MTYPAAEQQMPVAQVWPPLLPHVSIEPVAVDPLIVEALEVGPAGVGEEVIDVSAEEYMDLVVVMTAEGSSLSNVSGR